MIPRILRGANNLHKMVRYNFSERDISAQGLKFDRLAKEKLIEENNFARVMISSGRYKLEYFHTFGSNDKVAESNRSLVTTNGASSVVHIQTHDIVGVSTHETLQDIQSQKWIKFTRNGNQLVDNEADATWLQVLGFGSHYVLQYVNPTDPTTSYQVGVDNGPIGTELRLEASKTEFFKLIPA